MKQVYWFCLVLLLAIFLVLTVNENWGLKREIRDAKIFIEHYKGAISLLGYARRFPPEFVVVDRWTQETRTISANDWLENN